MTAHYYSGFMVGFYGIDGAHPSFVFRAKSEEQVIEWLRDTHQSKLPEDALEWWTCFVETVTGSSDDEAFEKVRAMSVDDIQDEINHMSHIDEDQPWEASSRRQLQIMAHDGNDVIDLMPLKRKRKPQPVHTVNDATTKRAKSRKRARKASS